MNKQQLQQELLKKVKPGVKPSDLKKQGKFQPNLNQNQNNYSGHGIPTPPPTPPLKPSQREDLPSPIEIELEQAIIRPKSPSPAKDQAFIKPFRCSSCLTTKKATPTWIKVAQNDPQYNLTKGQAYPFCSTCAPKIKEFNEYDLITPDLWEKYPYSEAKEILELEFGIKEDNHD